MCGKKLRILTFASCYLPGYKAGGPVRTIANMVDHLGDEFAFSIVTRDRDAGDIQAYPDIRPNTWQAVGKAQVFYLPPQLETLRSMCRLMRKDQHDVVYLNSFFDFRYTFLPLLANRWLLGDKRKPVILAPRGELAAAAVRLKGFKKRIYLAVSKLAGLYNDVVFQASSRFEAADIRTAFGSLQQRVKIAIDLPEKQEQAGIDVAITPADTEVRSPVLRIVFLSRIAPMKNLDYAIEVLGNVRCPVLFDIYGPLEDEDYWASCQRRIARLPANIITTYHGSIPPSCVRKVFSQYDLFLLPTRGENYGHVIAESLSVGTPVLISDQTPWRDLEADGLGWDVPLDQAGVFAGLIEKKAQESPDERRLNRSTVRQGAIKRLSAPELVQQNRDLFLAYATIATPGQP